jgi:HlyD family secretion protein
MPRPPRSAPRTEQNDKDKQSHVWILNDAALVKIPIATGMTNGVLTEARGDGLKPGMKVVVDVVEAGK